MASKKPETAKVPNPFLLQSVLRRNPEADWPGHNCQEQAEQICFDEMGNLVAVLEDEGVQRYAFLCSKAELHILINFLTAASK
jgi:hypothetical protein